LAFHVFALHSHKDRNKEAIPFLSIKTKTFRAGKLSESAEEILNIHILDGYYLNQLELNITFIVILGKVDFFECCTDFAARMY